MPTVRQRGILRLAELRPDDDRSLMVGQIVLVERPWETGAFIVSAAAFQNERIEWTNDSSRILPDE